MQLGYTILYVPSVPAALDFYERAFKLQRRFLAEGGDYGELDTGTTALAFGAHSLLAQMGKTPQAPDPQRPVFEIALLTPDVPAAVARAQQAGATLLQAPKTMSWGQTVAYVADLNGYWVELCTPTGGGA